MTSSNTATASAPEKCSTASSPNRQGVFEWAYKLHLDHSPISPEKFVRCTHTEILPHGSKWKSYMNRHISGNTRDDKNFWQHYAPGQWNMHFRVIIAFQFILQNHLPIFGVIFNTNQVIPVKTGLLTWHSTNKIIYPSQQILPSQTLRLMWNSSPVTSIKVTPEAS